MLTLVHRFRIALSVAAWMLLATCSNASPPDPVVEPSIVSVSSLQGTEVGICFSTAMDNRGLQTPANYHVLSGTSVIKVSSVSIWEEDASKVSLRLAQRISGTFTVSVSGLKDGFGIDVSKQPVEGVVWGQSFTLSNLGSPSTARLFSCVSNEITMVGQGFICNGGCSSQIPFLSELRTNDFDIQVRVDSLSKPEDASIPLLAGANLAIYDPSSPAKAFTINAFPSNGSRLWMGLGYATWDDTPHIATPFAGDAGTVASYPVWLRIRRSGQELHCFYSANGLDWVSTGRPNPFPSPAVVQVGLMTLPFDSNVFATAHYSEFGDTPLNAQAQLQIVSQPLDATIEENHTAHFEAAAAVTVVSFQDLIYQWQMETAPQSGVFSDVPLATKPHFVTPSLKQSDSGKRVRMKVHVSGGPTVTTASALVNVISDVTGPRVISAIWRSGWKDIAVLFSEPIPLASAVKVSNYSGSDFDIESATLDSSKDRVFLKPTTALDLTTSHELHVAGVKDVAGNNLVSSEVSTPIQLGEIQRGAALEEIYLQISGTSIADLQNASRYPDAPNSRSLVSSLESPNDVGDNYGTRISGLLIPPVTGNYHFWISSDDQGEFWLSVDEDPSHLVLLCNEPSWNPSRAYNVTVRRNVDAPENRSSTLFPDGISLIAGTPYYFEALSKEGPGAAALSVAWQIPGSEPPKDGEPGISGAYLALRGPAERSQIEITQEPSSVTVFATAGDGSPVQTLVDENLDATDGGFTMEESGNTEGPWTYDPTLGTWSARGSTSVPVSEKLLTSPTWTISQEGEVRLHLYHRFSFQSSMVDGGQIHISRNDGPFTLLPPIAFATNGYTGNIIGSYGVFDTPGFGNRSEGYLDGQFILSEASLGLFHPGDHLAIRFAGRWDFGDIDLTPGWEIDRVWMTQGHEGINEAQFAVQAALVRDDNLVFPLSYAWQKDCGLGFHDIPGANESTYRFIPSVADASCQFRCQVFVPGNDVISQTVKLSIGLSPLHIQHTPAGIQLLWLGQAGLESSASTLGPWTPVPSAVSPYTPPSTLQTRFYRLHSNQ